MCPQCVGELTQRQKIKPSLYSSVPKSFKNGRIQISIRAGDAPPTWATLHLQTDRNRYQKSLPSTRNRHQERVRSHETARKRWRRCSTYARPVSGAVVCHKSSEEDFSRMVAMVALLFILRCGRSGSFSPSPRQAFAPTAVILSG